MDRLEEVRCPRRYGTSKSSYASSYSPSSKCRRRRTWRGTARVRLSEEVLEVHLDGAVERAGVEEALLVRERAAELLDGHALVAELALELGHLGALRLHDVRVAEDEAVAVGDDLLVVRGEPIRARGRVDADPLRVELVEPQLGQRVVAGQQRYRAAW